MTISQLSELHLLNAIKNKDKTGYLTYLDNKVLSSLYLNPPTYAEVYGILNSLNIRTSTGPDDIPSYFIKTATSVLTYLVFFISMSFKLGIFPTCLKTAKVIPAYKKDPVTKTENYRPISLLPTTAKVFEKILLNRLLSFFNQNLILQDTQYGFRKKHNTIHAVLDVITQLYITLQTTNFILTLDLKRAFDTIKHYILLGKLKHYGVRGICNTLLYSYLKNRNQFVSFQNNYSSLKSLSCGLPQGSILSPFLFFSLH